jgi:hypothetical protein
MMQMTKDVSTVRLRLPSRAVGEPGQYATGGRVSDCRPGICSTASNDRVPLDCHARPRRKGKDMVTHCQHFPPAHPYWNGH